MTNKRAPRLLLFGRSGLFLAMQAALAIAFLLAGVESPWRASAAWWPLTVSVVNLVLLAILVILYRDEGGSYWSIFRIHRQTLGRDLIALVAALLVIGPIGFFPNILLAGVLFDSPQAALDLFVRPLPMWAAYVQLVLFPVTQGLVEVPLYFIYVMPRLDARSFPDLRPVVLPALMLGLQHVVIPLLFNVDFILWRSLMFIPFAFALGILMLWRPRLLPYIAVIHVLMDLSVSIYFL